MVSNGGKGVLWNALMATVDPGDEVIIPAPYWGAYPLMVRVVGAEPVAVNCPQNNGFRLRPEDLEAAITPRTKWLMLNFPNNPTGTAASAEDLRGLGEVLLRYPHVWVLSDDMYEHLMFDGLSHHDDRGGRAAAAGPDADGFGSVEDLRDDGLARRFRRRAAASDPGDGDDAGACGRGGQYGRAGGGGGGAGWAAG